MFSCFLHSGGAPNSYMHYSLNNAAMRGGASFDGNMPSAHGLGLGTGGQGAGGDAELRPLTLPSALGLLVNQDRSVGHGSVWQVGMGPCCQLGMGPCGKQGTRLCGLALGY